MSQNPSFKALLLDIEGTTTSISFVKDTLFPYAARNVHKYLTENMSNSSSSVTELVDALIQLSNEQNLLQPTQIEAVEKGEEPDKIVAKLAANVKMWIEQDKKLTALKQLQGLMWQQAYVNGESKAMCMMMCQWLLKSCKHGDLTEFLTGYFDTNVGPKVDPLSYQRISKDIKVNESEILFATDVHAEAIAALEAGLQVALVVRPGNAPLSEEARKKFRTVDNIKQILL
uniref:Enolase-phosphatase E1 n=1 Tax=Ditylenchus dipsaci TaxID=166011 RepID=A0A915E6Y3_9BILA